jgi:phage terminase small subunit
VAYDCSDLTDKQRKLAEEWLIDVNVSAAGERAGYATKGGSYQAFHLPHVQAYIEYLCEERAKRLQISQDDVLSRLWAMATADVNEVVQYRRCACRFCYGEGHRYQWTVHEYERAVFEANRLGWPQPEAPGGVGFDRTRDPNPDCPDCRGEGSGDIFARDTRNLKGGARALYAGAKSGRDGLEVKVHDQLKILELIGKHLGMFKEKVEHSGKVESTAPTLNLTLTNAAPATPPNQES